MSFGWNTRALSATWLTKASLKNNNIVISLHTPPRKEKKKSLPTLVGLWWRCDISNYSTFLCVVSTKTCQTGEGDSTPGPECWHTKSGRRRLTLHFYNGSSMSSSSSKFPFTFDFLWLVWWQEQAPPSAPPSHAPLDKTRRVIGRRAGTVSSHPPSVCWLCCGKSPESVFASGLPGLFGMKWLPLIHMSAHMKREGLSRSSILSAILPYFTSLLRLAYKTALCHFPNWPVKSQSSW